MINNEEKVNNFLEELLYDKAPDYSELGRKEDLIEIAEISLLLKEGISGNSDFKDKLAQRLNKVYNKQYGKATNAWSKRVMFNILSVGLSFSLFLIALNPFIVKPYKKYSVHIPNMKKMSEQNSEPDIVKINTYRFTDKKAVRLLYNERNNVILYWPFGQLAIFQ
jgi:hypothetical protein